MRFRWGRLRLRHGRFNGVLVPLRQDYIDPFTHDPQSQGDALRTNSRQDGDFSRSPTAREKGHWIGTRQDGARACGGTYLPSGGMRENSFGLFGAKMGRLVRVT
jgi:hypothetical protein